MTALGMSELDTLERKYFLEIPPKDRRICDVRKGRNEPRK